MTKKQAKQIEKLLADIDIDVYADDLLDIEDVDGLEQWLDDNDFLNVDVIYYKNAMDYLAEYDASLRRGLELAHDMREAFNGVRDDIDKILS